MQGEAEPLLREVLQGYRETLGPKHPGTLASMTWLRFSTARAAIARQSSCYGKRCSCGARFSARAMLTP